MAETLAPGGSAPHGSEDLVLEEVDVVSSEDETDLGLERERLVRHQQKLRLNGLPAVPQGNRLPYPRPSSATDALSRQLPVLPSVVDDAGQKINYAAAVGRAVVPVEEVIVGRSGGLRMNNIGRPRPRTVCVHSGRGAIDCKARIAKLETYLLEPTHVQRLPNGDLEVTFPTVADKDRFLGLGFVRHPRCPWQPGLRDPPPAWVRVFNKPGEIRPEVVERRLSRVGRVLFARENTHPGTNKLNGVMTLKMIMTEPIPSYVHLGPTFLLVRHEGQPMTCRKCDSRTHLAANCSAKRCYNCGCVGHINADCPESSVCQGCGSSEHHLAQCDTSFFPHPSGTDDEESIPETPTETTMAFDILGSEAGSSASEDEATAVSEEPTPDPASALEPLPTEELQNDKEQTSLEAPPSKPEEPPSLSTPEDLSNILEDAQPTKNWYDTLSFQQGTNTSSKFSSPLPPFPIPSVDAGVPAASKRTFQDDNVSDISAVRRPSTKKKPKGRSARQPPPN